MIKAVTYPEIVPSNRIVIELELNQDYKQIAAGKYINRVENISKQFQLDDDQIQAYDDFISSIVTVLNGAGFEIIAGYQSDVSYSYYIAFYPTDTNGNRLDAFEIEFRISDHINRGLSESSVTTSKNRIFKSFIIGGERYPSTASIMIAVAEICVKLKSGNYDVLDEV